MVALISRCEETGLVSRNASRGDRRLVEIRLTRKGERVLEVLARLHRAELLSLQAQFAVPDLARLGRP